MGRGEAGREAIQDIQAAADSKDDERMKWKTVRGIIKRPQKSGKRKLKERRPNFKASKHLRRHLKRCLYNHVLSRCCGGFVCSY